MSTKPKSTQLTKVVMSPTQPPPDKLKDTNKDDMRMIVTGMDKIYKDVIDIKNINMTSAHNNNNIRSNPSEKKSKHFGEGVKSIDRGRRVVMGEEVTELWSSSFLMLFSFLWPSHLNI